MTGTPDRSGSIAPEPPAYSSSVSTHHGAPNEQHLSPRAANARATPSPGPSRYIQPSPSEEPSATEDPRGARLLSDSLSWSEAEPSGSRPPLRHVVRTLWPFSSEVSPLLVDSGGGPPARSSVSEETESSPPAPNPLDINPETINLPLPFSTPKLKVVFRVRNTNSVPVVYKIMTTHPKLYSVRPNLGTIGVGMELDLEIQVTMDTSEQELSARRRDRFALLSRYIPSRGVHSRDDIARLFPRRPPNPGPVHVQKFRITYSAPVGAPSTTLDSMSPTRSEPSSPIGLGGFPESVASPAMSALHLTALQTSPMNIMEIVRPTRVRSPTIRFDDRKAMADNSMATGSRRPLQGAELAGREVEARSVIADVQASVASLKEMVNSLSLQLAEERSARTASAAAVSRRRVGIPIHYVATMAFAIFVVTYLCLHLVDFHGRNWLFRVVFMYWGGHN